MRAENIFADVSGHEYKSILGSELNTVLAFAVPSVLIPFAIHSSAFPNQLIVGTIVNALLALSAFFLCLRSSAPLIILPSVAAVASGVVFGGFSVFLACLVPFIWVGNAAYVYAIKRFKIVGNMNYAISALCASFIKACAIGLPAYALFSLGFFPQALVLPMTIVQFATALMGSVVAYPAVFVLKLKKSNHR